jgi:hypothetical protein
MGTLGPMNEEVSMRGRRIDLRPTAAVRLRRALADRMKLGMGRLTPILRSIARDGLGQFLRARPSGSQRIPNESRLLSAAFPSAARAIFTAPYATHGIPLTSIRFALSYPLNISYSSNPWHVVKTGCNYKVDVLPTEEMRHEAVLAAPGGRTLATALRDQR